MLECRRDFTTPIGILRRAHEISAVRFDSAAHFTRVGENRVRRRRRRRDRSLLAFLLGERRVPPCIARICCILGEQQRRDGVARPA